MLRPSLPRCLSKATLKRGIGAVLLLLPATAAAQPPPEGSAQSEKTDAEAAEAKPERETEPEVAEAKPTPAEARPMPAEARPQLGAEAHNPSEPSAQPAASMPAELSDEEIEQREQARQAALEVAEPRPQELDVVVPEPPAWERHLELGADFAFVLRPLSNGEVDNGTRYSAAPGYGFHVRWNMLRWLRFHFYFVDAHHSIELTPGALATGLSDGIDPAATVEEPSVSTFVFGGRLAPTWNISDRFRGWLAVGVGWGRFEYPTMVVTETGGQQFEVRERAGVFVEFPFSVGASFDVIEHWLAVELESTAAPVTGQSGSGHSNFQATDADGNIRSVAGFGAIEASFVQTLGLSLIL